MKYLSVDHVLRIHARMIEKYGGDPGARDRGLIESAVAQPRMTFGGRDLYPDLISKAAALGYSLNMNHGFQDGNKRTSHAAVEMFLRRNGYEILAPVDEQERIFLEVASGARGRDEFAGWLKHRSVRKGGHLRPDKEWAYEADLHHGPILKGCREHIEYVYAQARASGFVEPMVLAMETRYDTDGRGFAQRFFSGDPKLKHMEKKVESAGGTVLLFTAVSKLDALGLFSQDIPSLKESWEAIPMNCFLVFVMAGGGYGAYSIPIPDVALG